MQVAAKGWPAGRLPVKLPAKLPLFPGVARGTLSSTHLELVQPHLAPHPVGPNVDVLKRRPRAVNQPAGGQEAGRQL